MRTSLILAMCMAVLLAGVARADLPEGTFAPEIEAKEWMNTEDPVSLTELRGMVVVLFFWVSFHAGGERTMTLMNLVEANPGLGRARGVFVCGLTDAARSQVEKSLANEKVFFPVGVESKSQEDYRITSWPRCVIIDAEGRVAWSGWPGEGGGDALVKKVLEVLAKTAPTRTHPLEAAKARQHIEEARTAIRAKEFRDAHKAAREAVEHALPNDSSLHVWCQDMVDLIDAIGQDKLAQAEKLIDAKNFDQGIALLREVMRDFQGVDAGKSAKTRLEALAKQHAQVQQILDDQTKASSAKAKLADAIDELKRRRFGEAYEQLGEVVKEGAGGDAAREAQKVLDRMKKNEGIMGYVRDYQASKDCEAWLAQARNFVRANQPAKAKQLLTQIIEKYGDTIYADQAIEELRKIP
jgi:tetratricopeptide (TPR) repeat protein